MGVLSAPLFDMIALASGSVSTIFSVGVSFCGMARRCSGLRLRARCVRCNVSHQPEREFVFFL